MCPNQLNGTECTRATRARNHTPKLGGRHQRNNEKIIRAICIAHTKNHAYFWFQDQN